MSDIVFGSGCLLLVVGVYLWNLPRILTFKGILPLRRDYAAKLRVAGEVERAAKVEAGTDIILHRVPIYGRLLVAVATAVLVVATFI